MTATVGEAARAMAMRAALAAFGDVHLDPCLHGPADLHKRPDGRHLHAYWLPMDEDGDGRIDHLTVSIEGGATPRTRAVLSHCKRLEVYGHGSASLVLLPPLAPKATALRLWVSTTPYVGQRFAVKRHGKLPRAGLSAAEQLADELAHHRNADGSALPKAAVLPHPEPARSADAFLLGARAKNGDDLRPRCWLAILFATPVQGPLAFGLGAHFGLGQFGPASTMVKA